MVKKALLIGILYNGTSSQLTGCENDVEVFLDLLTNRYGFDPEDITKLTESSGNLPNEENIRSEIARLIEGGNVGDTLVLVYSGHGTSLPDYNGSEPDGRCEALCPVGDPMPGSFWSHAVIPDSDVTLMFEELADGVTMYCFFDCCHSGTMLDLDQEREVQSSKAAGCGLAEVKSKRLEPTDDERAEIDRLREERAFRQTNRHVSPYQKMKGVSGGRHIYSFSGCQDGQTSADSSRGVGGQWNGAFTTALFRILSKTPTPTVGNLIDDMRVNLKNTGYSQIPHLSLDQESSFRDIFMAETDAPSLDEGGAESEGIREVETRDIVAVAASGGPTSFQDWPALEYLSLEVTEDVLPLGEVFAEVTASDQAWGGTGSSKVVLVLFSEEGEIKSHAQVAMCNQHLEHYHLKLRRSTVLWLQDAAIGDRLALLLVSAPWAGWECRAAQGCIRVQPVPRMEPFTAKAEKMEQGIVTAAEQGRTELEIEGWPSKVHSSLVLQRGSVGLGEIEVRCIAADQGFGNTGSSKMVLVLRSKQGEVLEVKAICDALTHSFAEYHLTLSAADLEGASPGDSLAVVMVSAPWPGWACRCMQSRILARLDPDCSKGLEMPGIQPPELYELSDTVQVCADDAGYTDWEVDSWPAEVVLRAPLIEGKTFPPSRVSVTFTASDQGFGGSDAAKLVLAIIDSGGDLTHHTQVGNALTHDLQEYRAHLTLSNSFLAHAEPGDFLALLVVSPPWPAWAARCSSARLEVTAFGNAEIVAKIKETFRAADSDGSGVLDEEQFLDFAAGIDVDGEALWSAVDKNGDGCIDLGEFIEWVFQEDIMT